MVKKAVRELEDKLLRLNDYNQSLTSTSLAIAVARLNTRILYHGLSSRELWTQRDNFTHQQNHLDDYKLMQEQHHRRFTNWLYVNQKTASQTNTFKIGTLVFLINEKSKSNTRYTNPSFAPSPWQSFSHNLGARLKSTMKVCMSKSSDPTPKQSSRPWK